MAKRSVSYHWYRLLYIVTLDRKWLLKCVDVIQRDTRDEVLNFLDSKEVLI